VRMAPSVKPKNAFQVCRSAPRSFVASMKREGPRYSGESRMKFMIIAKANADSEAGKMPSDDLIAAMGQFNEQLVDAGVLIAGEGLQESRKGARVSYSSGRFVVTDGPFAETKELIAGFWIVDVRSKEEAIEWVK